MDTLNLVPIIDTDTNKLDEAYEVTADIQAVSQGTEVWVPKYFQYDGASIPMSVWQLIGTPFNPRFMVAAVFHDWLYHTHQITREQTDDFFYQLLLANKVSKTKAVLMREAVQSFGGWYWDNDKDDTAYLKRLTKKIQQDGRNPAKYGIQ